MANVRPDRQLLKMMKYTLAIILLFSSLLSLAEIYKWTDEQGNVHFGDSHSKPSGKHTKRVNIKTNTYTNITYELTTNKSDRVIMYSAAWCGYCKKARNYFIANHIPFTEHDIDKDNDAKRRHKGMGATGVPVILYKDKKMNGFSEFGFNQIV